MFPQTPDHVPLDLSHNLASTIVGASKAAKTTRAAKRRVMMEANLAISAQIQVAPDPDFFAGSIPVADSETRTNLITRFKHHPPST